ncbi:MAG TPA: hypothetical protein VN811_13360 [Thermoanaerobaculia bacterium]|nr:hypothetical protein [Thermoanaerobaculia bacterium]
MGKKASVPGSFTAQLVTPPLAVNRFVQRDDTPGNVAVCLSGGGSRALTAGLGQLRALSYLQLNGKSLLSQTKALSTVSGGSWVGVTFEFLAGETTDAAYLNDYVPDPGTLVPTRTGDVPTAQILDELPNGNLGNSINTDLFSIPALALEAFLLYKFLHTPENFLWQALIGLHIMGPYGLDNLDHRNGLQPTSLFSWDPQSLAAEVTDPNPSLAGETAHLIASSIDPARTRRPFLLCNTSLFLNEPETKVQFLAPVQATAFFTGVVGAPTGTDANGRTPGGGGVTSFAFDSAPTAVAGPQVTVSQDRQWALVDIVGASSAAYAETLQNQVAEWRQDTSKFKDAINQFADRILDWLAKRLPKVELELAKVFVDAAKDLADFGLVAEIKSDLNALQDLIPEYQYWPVAGVQPWPDTKPTRFADGGSLENLGVASMLSYTDIDNIISFINSSTPLAKDSKGVIIVDGALPPLFGYQPYQSGSGYVLYEGAEDPNSPIFGHSQVFSSDQFQPLLDGLWAASGGDASPNTNPATFKQTLQVLDNAWFGVHGGDRTVNVLWCYMNRVNAWYDLLNSSVQQILGDPTDPHSYHSFPHYSTADTHLDATEINLLASMTAWAAAADPNSAQFLGMYAAPATPPER